jgi:hypothetical protein
MCSFHCHYPGYIYINLSLPNPQIDTFASSQTCTT